MHTPIRKFIFLLIVLVTTIAGHTGISDTNSTPDSETNSTTTQAQDTSTDRSRTDETDSLPVKKQMDSPLVCLSPGHPSFEGDKHYEAIINRKVTWFLTILLLEANYDVMHTVTDVTPDKLFFTSLSNDDNALWSDLRVMTPEEKAIRCNDANADYLISIHHNYAYSPAMNDTMVFYTVNKNYRPVHDEVIPWAEKTAFHLGKAMETDSSAAIADMERIGFQLGVLINAEMPGILTEASFYSNPEERNRLNDDQYLEREAEAIFNAFVAQFQ